MSETQARRVAVEFTVDGGNHTQIVEKATRVWREYIGDAEAVLPFDTEFNVTAAHTVNAVDGTLISVEWEATVIIRQRGSNYN